MFHLFSNIFVIFLFSTYLMTKKITKLSVSGMKKKSIVKEMAI